MLVDTNDLIPAQNQGALYFAEAEYIVPHEYTWCQSHPGQCNMYNNASYERYTVSGGPTTFTFSRRWHHRARAASDHGLDRRDSKPAGA